jgi:hypothetical protein
MDQNTCTTKPTTLATSVPTGSGKALTKVEKPEAKPSLSILRITRLSKDACVDIEASGGTTAIKLDKYRIEMYGNIKLNIR